MSGNFFEVICKSPYELIVSLMIMRCARLLILLGWALTLSLPASADVDYLAGISGRTYPLGLIAQGTLGYSWKLWGEDPLAGLPPAGPRSDGGTGPWKFGLARLSGTAQTLGVVNRAHFETEIYPIAPIGVAAGVGVHSRIKRKVSPFDCEQLRCDGVLGRAWVRTQAVAGIGRLFFATGGRLDRFQSVKYSSDFVEETSNLIGRQPGDTLLNGWGLFGVTLPRAWQVMTWVNRAKFIRSGSESVTISAGFAKALGRWSLGGGAAAYRSTHQPWGPSFFLQLQWIGKRSPVLF